MNNNAANVSTGKPRVGGAVFVAPIGTDLPNDAASELATAFKCVGYVSDSGVTESSNADTVKAWGGDVVMMTSERTYDFSLIESMNLEVMKVVYGATNVSGTLETGIIVKYNDVVREQLIYVFDMIANEGVLQRIVIPYGRVSEVGDVSYTDGDPIAYDTKITVVQDAAGNYGYKYVGKATV